MEEMDTSPLEAKLDELIALCEGLVQENKELREAQRSWTSERARLMERNELAKSKIDAMIGLLRTMDEDN